LMTTSAPARASSKTQPLPMPRAAPVTKAFFPSSLMSGELSLGFRRDETFVRGNSDWPVESSRGIAAPLATRSNAPLANAHRLHLGRAEKEVQRPHQDPRPVPRHRKRSVAKWRVGAPLGFPQAVPGAADREVHNRSLRFDLVRVRTRCTGCVGVLVFTTGKSSRHFNALPVLAQPRRLRNST